ncbi:hypothetical protein ACFRMN_15665 [Streptomyces sp. NPDC056835]|uniref:hypothetical protein n=1 Tax=Streptomyces sp. NPDC056835 TaxID=3345956 RepID=UPI0036B86A56
MHGPAVTAFSETAALYAIVNEDTEEAERIVSGMLQNERAEFARQLDQLRGMLTDRFGNDQGGSPNLDEVPTGLAKGAPHLSLTEA